MRTRALFQVLWTIVGILVIRLLLGAATPFHEVKPTYTNTFSYYELQTISEEELYQGPNVCGNPDSFFWKYLAR